MSKSFNLVAFVTSLLMLPVVTFAQNTYDINLTPVPPTIDGVVSPGEWDDAAAAQGGWRLLRVAGGPVEAHNNRFRMTWDATHLYLLAESDFGGWTTNQRDEYRGGANNLNMFFDPDLDGEGNQGTETAPFLTPDSYQINVNQYLGTFMCPSGCSVEMDNNPNNVLLFGATGSNLSTFAGARFDGLFGNNAGWLGMRGTSIGTVNSASGGVVEMAIPWTDFDAPNLDADGNDPGLNLNGMAPTAGDTWNFNISQITTDNNNLLPVWNWHDNPDPDANEFFASQPHGVITFVGSSVLLGDVNLDTVVNFLDISPFITVLSTADDNQAEADINEDGLVNFLDIAPFINLLAQQ